MTHDHFMQIAIQEAEKSLAANNFPVGCALVYEDTVLTKGHRINSQSATANELDHAEIVALRTLMESHPDIDRTKVIAYSTMEPCLMCFATLLLNDIRTFVYSYEDAMGGGTNLPLSELSPLYQEMQVKIIPHILRDESLKLFKDFFQNPNNDYWQNSMLAEYTLSQP